MRKRNQAPFSKPLLLGCTWYTYGRGAPPWGVAQSDLLFGQVPASLIFAPKLLCDTAAYEQEARALSVLGWTSSELLVLLKEKEVLETRDFQSKVGEIFSKGDLDVQLKAGLEKPSRSVLQAVRELDNVITQGLAGEGIATNDPKEKQVLLWRSAQRPSPKPFWAGLEEAVLELFLDPGFYLLPKRDLWPEEAQMALREISLRQETHLEDLASLRVEPPAYLDRIAQAHGRLDRVIDNFLRSHTAPPYGSYRQRLGHLLEVREKLQASAVLEDMARDWTAVEKSRLTREEFLEDYDRRLRSETDDFLRAKRTRIHTLGIRLTVSLTTGLGAALGNAAVLAPVFLVSAGSLFEAIYGALRLEEDYPLGWLGAARSRLERRSASRSG